MTFRGSLALVLILSILWVLSGCSQGADRDRLSGRWLEDGERTFIDFGPQHFYALYELEKPVEVGTWSLQEGHIVLKTFTGDNKERKWEIGDVDKTFRVKLNEARYREFRKAQSNSLPDERLVGLWISQDDPADVFEFTPGGTLIGLVWRQDDKGELVNRGAWGKTSTAGTDKFYLEGHMGTVHLTQSTVHSYKMEDNRLLWDSGGHKRKLRQITSIDQIPISDFPTP